MVSGPVVAGGDIPVIPTDQMNIVEVPGERQVGRGPHTASVMGAPQLGSPRHTAPYSQLSNSPAVRVAGLGEDDPEARRAQALLMLEFPETAEVPLDQPVGSALEEDGVRALDGESGGFSL